MSTNEIILAVVCAALVVFSLVVALVVPKRNPDFPAKKLGAFFLVSIALVVAMLAAVEVFGTEEGHEAEAAEPAAPPETGAPAPGEPGGEEPPPGDAAAGKVLFASQPCGDCHTLSDAGSSGTVGPNLDELQPDFAAVVEIVTGGRGAMPAFGGQLSEEQIQDLAAYVSQATAG